MHYVYSTLPFDQNYNIYTLTPDGVPILSATIGVKGGAQVADGTGFNIETPLGLVTRVTDEEAGLLSSHDVFKKHMRDGFVKIEASRQDVDKVVSGDMVLPDETQGAPMTEQSIEKIHKQKGITVKAEQTEE